MLVPLAGGIGTVVKLGELMMILELHRQGLTVSAIARQLGMDRKTVRRYIARGLEPPSYGPRPRQQKGTHPFLSYLRERLAAYPGLTAVRLWRELRERGYAGGYTAVKRTVRDIRPEPVKPFEVRFETPPGAQAQVDLARFEVVFADEPGITRIVWLFSLVLGFSRLIWARFVVHQDLQTILRCHIAALEAIGGAPQEILYDRMKTAVIGEDADGLVVYNRGLLDLARHYGFQPRACRPYRPKTKGKVERPFRYIREDFFLGGSFRNLDDLNAQLRHWLDTVANPRVHATTQRIVNEAFAEEKSALKPLPLAPYRTVLKLERRVSHEGMVSVGGNLYSVPDTTRRRILDVHVFADEICIFENGVLVATHVPLEGPRPETRRPRSSEGLVATTPTPERWQAHRHSPRRRPGRPPLARLLRRRRSPARRSRRHPMSARVEIIPSLVERIKQTMVGLKMPRAIEILDATLRRLERGEMTALEAIDALLAEEFTLRENRRVKTALVMARLSAIKTLAGFDFSFQPSLDKNRIMALAELTFIDRAEVLHLVGPPGTGKSHLEPGARRRSRQSRSQRLLHHARRSRRRARQGRT